MLYIASVRDKETKEIKIFEMEYRTKKDFYIDLRNNGYSVRFITTEEKFDEDCEKFYMRLEKQKEVNRMMYKAHKRLANEFGMTMKDFKNTYLKNNTK